MNIVDMHRFDNLVRALADRATRRGLLGAALGLGATIVGTRSAGAACPPGQVHRRRAGCICRLTGRPPAGGVCPCPRDQTDAGDGLGCLECRSVTECDGGTPCTVATCEPAGDCVYTPLPDGEQGQCPPEQVCQEGDCAACGLKDQPCCAGDVCSEAGCVRGWCIFF